jgi:hypothetical protein
MRQTNRPEYEQAMVKAFIVPRKQQRWLDFLAKPRRRNDVLRTMPHLKDLDARFLLRVPVPQSTSIILEMLHRCGGACAVDVRVETKKHGNQSPRMWMATFGIAVEAASVDVFVDQLARMSMAVGERAELVSAA